MIFALGATQIACNSSSDPAIPPALTLSGLDVQSNSHVAFPQFDEQTRHYAIRCGSTDMLTVQATATRSEELVSIDGSTPVSGSAEAELSNLGSDQDIVVEVSSGALSEQYTVHCLDEFLDIQVLRSDPEVTPDLMLMSPNFQEVGTGESKTYLMILDNNGVPHWRRKIDARVIDFKRHPNGQYSYALWIGPNQFGRLDSVIVLLDEEFNELDRLTTVGLTHTDFHDFIITDEGNHIFISYNSVTRDMTAFGLSAQELVEDSVIQEVTPSGQVVFEWNSWDHMNVADCQATGSPPWSPFPRGYAHLNSIALTPAGDLIGSFALCSQVLKIDRPTGDVIWQLGGGDSDFAIVGDSFNEFCFEHTPSELSGDRVLLFDNGGQQENLCFGDRIADFGQFSRAVEYQLDFSTGQASFVRDHSLFGTYQVHTPSQGSVQALDNGNWLINWGNVENDAMSVTEVTPSGDEILAIKILYDGNLAVSYRAVRDPDVDLD